MGDKQAVGVIGQVVAGQQEGTVGVATQVGGNDGDDLVAARALGGPGRS